MTTLIHNMHDLSEWGSKVVREQEEDAVSKPPAARRKPKASTEAPT